MTQTGTPVDVDRVDYEIFAHRLWAIGEEGRIALQRVTASPIVAQGGECMCSFYDADGRMILACSGHLRFAAATSDAIAKLIEWFDTDPGINEGDEFIFNDPYVAGSHTYDIMQIAPVFWEGRRVAWVASSSHTADTGGVLRGAATEIFHEGIRLLGLKVVERGQARNDVFKTITEQCRDPLYVGMEIKSRTAANNVAIRGFHGLIERFGIEFVNAAGHRLISDAEAMARSKLRAIPDGVWRSRIYGSARDPRDHSAIPYQVVCTATKQGDALELDFSGSSAQFASDQNSTLPSTIAHVAIALTNQLFWDVPWSDGRMAPVTIKVPEGSALHCRFPAACGRSPRIGQYVVEAVRECLARMLYAAGQDEGVNASWGSFWYLGGPGFFYGGTNAQGLPVPQGLYDIHGGGLGAAPHRDGQPTGGQANIPSGGISDVERVELSYPFIYLGRNHGRDSGGAGRWVGGAGSYRLLMVRGSKDVTADFSPYAGMPHGAFGLFGGYPSGTGGLRAILQPTEPASGSLISAQGDETPVGMPLLSTTYPDDPSEALARGLVTIVIPKTGGRVAVAEGVLLSDFVQGGGGFGDPLDRPPSLVARDVNRGIVSASIARVLYGVSVDERGVLDEDATTALRDEIREQRRAGTRAARMDDTERAIDDASGRQTDAGSAARGQGDMPDAAIRFHASLTLERPGSSASRIRCRCGHVLCRGDENYKRYAARRDRPLQELAGRPMPDGSPYLAVLREYACPRCAVLLQVDVWCPSLGGDEDLWDTRIG